MDDYVRQVSEGREQLENELASWNIRFWPSRANFVLMHLGEKCKPFVQAMRQRGILVRDRSSDPGCQDCVRITVGLREQTELLIANIREVFADLGIRQEVAR